MNPLTSCVAGDPLGLAAACLKSLAAAVDRPTAASIPWEMSSRPNGGVDMILPLANSVVVLSITDVSGRNLVATLSVGSDGFAVGTVTNEEVGRVLVKALGVKVSAVAAQRAAIVSEIDLL